MSSEVEEIVWQDLPPSDKAAFVINSGHLADCRFIVGRDPENLQTFTSHQLLLSFASPVFEAMFFNNLKDAKKPTEIRLEDIEPIEFAYFLQFIYAKETRKLKKLRTCLLISLAALSNKYMVTFLEKACIEVIKERILSFDKEWKQAFEGVDYDSDWIADYAEPEKLLLCINDLLNIFTYAKRFNTNELLKVCIECIQTVAKEIIHHPQIFDLKMAEFKDFLIILNGHVREERRFHMIEVYVKENKLIELRTDYIENEIIKEETTAEDSKNKIENESIECLDEIEEKQLSNLKYIDSLLKMINYKQMTINEFCNGPGDSDLLSGSAKYDLLAEIAQQYKIS